MSLPSARRRALLRAVPPPVLALLASACHVVAVDSRTGPPGVRVDGLIEGHAVVGFRDEDHVLHLDLFSGSSPGAIGELVVWRLARLEVGLAGLAVGLGPFDLALGTLFYCPHMPEFTNDGRAREPRDEHPGVEPGVEEKGAPEDAAEGAPAEPTSPVDG